MQILGSKRYTRDSKPAVLTLVANVTATLTTLLTLSCGTAQFANPPPPPPPPQAADIEAAVYLIGDAGYVRRGDPVLTQIRNELLDTPRDVEAIVVFLGDNVYWSGLHEPGHPDHEEGAAHLEAQIDVVRGTDARGIFIPGNHDWGYKDERGFAQIRRQEAYLAAAARQGARVEMLPRAGCPGPESLPIAGSALLVTLETDLWLRDHPPAVDCRHKTTDDALGALRHELQSNAAGDGRHVVVVAHHPLKTYGPHGGYFGLKDQFFPATNLWKPLYIPLPFIYPVVRNSGISRQDLSSGRYARMREAFVEVFTEFPGQPLVWAAGHDHSLQVFRGYELGVGYILVSGAGSRITNVGKDDALFAAGKQHGEEGYMKLEFSRDGNVVLSVITDGTASCPNKGSCPGEPMLRYWRRIAGG